MPKGFRLPRNHVTPGEDRKINDWVLTPSGVSTPNSLHTWDKGDPANEEILMWVDEWYWTENEFS